MTNRVCKRVGILSHSRKVVKFYLYPFSRTPLNYTYYLYIGTNYMNRQLIADHFATVCGIAPGGGNIYAVRDFTGHCLMSINA